MNILGTEDGCTCETVVSHDKSGLRIETQYEIVDGSSYPLYIERIPYNIIVPFNWKESTHFNEKGLSKTVSVNIKFALMSATNLTQVNERLGKVLTDLA